MAKDYLGISLLDIMPDSIRGDPQVQAAAKALDAELARVAEDIRENLLISRIDELPESVLDLLAWQWHVDFYQPLGMQIETKRKLIKESIAWHRIKGTPAAVEKVMSAAFDNSWVEEWFEYGGEPGHFRVKTTDVSNDPEVMKNMRAAIWSAKNVRSWLDGLQFILIIGDEGKDEQHSDETLTLADALVFLTSAWLTEAYPWCGRYANGAYHAGAVQYADGTWQADGSVTGNSAPPGHEDGSGRGRMADGTYTADGLLLAYSWLDDHQVVYADSPEPDKFTMGTITPYGLTDYLRQTILADGVYHAGGTITAWGEIPQDSYALAARTLLQDALAISEWFVIAQTMLYTDAGGTARLYYADGRFMAGPEEDTKAYPITANGDCFANGTYLAYGEAYYLATSNYTLGKPLKIANGFYRADGEEMAGPVPLYGRAGDAGEGVSLLLDAGGREDFIALEEQTGVASESCESVIIEETIAAAEPRMVIREGAGYSGHTAQADGTLAADGKATAGRDYDLHEAYVETIHGYSFLDAVGIAPAAQTADGYFRADGKRMADGLRPGYSFHHADGALLADGSLSRDRIVMQEQTGSLAESLSSSQWADGKHMADGRRLSSGVRPLDGIPQLDYGFAARENCSLIEAFLEGEENLAVKDKVATFRAYADGDFIADGSMHATGCLGCVDMAVLDVPDEAEEYMPLAESIGFSNDTSETLDCSESIAIAEARLAFKEGRGLDDKERLILANGMAAADGSRTAGKTLAQEDYCGLEAACQLADSLALSEGLALNIGIICQEQLRGTHHYWCDGSYLADGNTVPHIPITEALAV